MADQDGRSGARSRTEVRTAGRRRFKRCRSVIAGTVVAATAAAGLTFAVNPAQADHPPYDDVDIGSSLPVERSVGSLVNDNGTVVVSAYISTEFGGDRRIYSWTADEGAVDIGNLGIPDIVARDMNEAGQIVGDSAVTSTNGSLDSAFVWNPEGTMTALGTLGGANSRAAAINDAGAIVGAASLASGEWHAVVWSASGGIIDIGTAGRTSWADDVNEAGAVVGTELGLIDPVTHLPQPRRSFFWTPETGRVDMGDLGGEVGVVGLSDSGVATGTARTPDGKLHAFVWTLAGGLVDLGSAAGGDTIPEAINEHGEITGRAETVDFVQQAFYWSAATGFVILPMADLDEANPEAINSHGQIVGWGDSTTDGEEHMFVWSLADGYLDLGVGAGDDINDSGQIAARRYVPNAEGGIDSVAYLVSPSLADVTPPTVACTATPTFTSGQRNVTLSAVVTDAESGPATSPVSSPSFNVRRSAGRFTASVTGADLAGNTTTADCPYYVVPLPGGLGAAGEVEYTMTDLGAMLTGSDTSRASHINESGRVVVQARMQDDGNPHVFSWTAGEGFVDIGNIGVQDLSAADINDAGQIVGRGRFSEASPYDHGFVWTPGGTMVDLDPLGGPSSYAAAINDAGTVVGSADISPDETRAFVWTAAGGMVDLGATGRSSVGVDVNDGGAVVGVEIGWADPNTGVPPANRSFYWTPELGRIDLGDLGGAVNVIGLNNNGQATGVATDPDGVQHAFVWTLGEGLVDLGSPLGGSTIPTAINERGNIVGRAYTTGDEQAYGFMWDNGNMDVLPAFGNVETEGVAVNDDRTVVGYSVAVSGRDEDEHSFAWYHLGRSSLHDLGLGDAQDINDAGQIVGRMRTPRATAYFLTPFVPDADGDGIEDILEVAGQPAAFADTNLPSPTSGTVVDPNGHMVTITDAAAPDGVRITVSGVGTEKATLSVCGMTLRLAPGADVVATCGSLSVRVVSGEAEVVSADGRIVVTVPFGSTVKVTDLGDGRHDVEHLDGTSDVTVSVDGAPPTAVVPGETTTVSAGDTTPPMVVCAAAPTFTIRQAGASVPATVSDDGSGPAAASVSATADVSRAGTFTVAVTGLDLEGNATTVDCGYSVVYRVEWLVPVTGTANRSVLRNTVVPFTFRVVDAAGRGVVGAVVTAPTSTPVTCPSGTPPLAVSVAGNAATTNVGQGWWLAGWKAQTAWKGTCRLVSIQLDDGVARTVLFKVI